MPMKSPLQTGRYESIWRLHDPHGNVFGEQLTVIIVVGNPTPFSTPLPSGYQAVAPVSVPTLGPLPAPSVCCKHCGEDSKLCGKSWIPLNYNCRVGVGCACP